MLLPLEPLMDVALDPVVDVPVEPTTGALGATGAFLGAVLPVEVRSSVLLWGRPDARPVDDRQPLPAVPCWRDIA
jgi:hypothetical protein